MYLFLCKNTVPHCSHSAAKEQKDPTCPTCGEETLVVFDHYQGGKLDQIDEDHGFNYRQLYAIAQELKRNNYSEAEIAYTLRLEATELRMLINRARLEQGKEMRSKEESHD